MLPLKILADSEISIFVPFVSAAVGSMSALFVCVVTQYVTIRNANTKLLTEKLEELHKAITELYHSSDVGNIRHLTAEQQLEAFNATSASFYAASLKVFPLIELYFPSLDASVRELAAGVGEVHELGKSISLFGQGDPDHFEKIDAKSTADFEKFRLRLGSERKALTKRLLARGSDGWLDF